LSCSAATPAGQPATAKPTPTNAAQAANTSTTPATGDQLVAIWDTRHTGIGGYGWAHWNDVCDWAIAHGATAHTYRLEISVLDCPLARVLDYATDNDGSHYIGPDGEIAEQPPRVIPLSELPPEHLRVNADAECTRRTAHELCCLLSPHHHSPALCDTQTSPAPNPGQDPGRHSPHQSARGMRLL
jgi:hypothetical protein